MTYRTNDIAVRGGMLRVGIWESADLLPDAPADRTVLAIHGVTSSHLAWSLVAEALVAEGLVAEGVVAEGVVAEGLVAEGLVAEGLVAERRAGTGGNRFIVPDLRGRGRSADLPGPWGMEQHSDDLQAVVAALGQPDVTVGHSMGGFVVVVAAHLHPGTLGDLVLVDGGVPLAFPEGVTIEALLKAVLGPAAERLAMTFADPEAYRRFWRDHPALAEDWSPAIEAYVDYDLMRGPDGWHSASRYAAVAEDTAQLVDGEVLRAAWADLVTLPTFLRSPLGLLAEAPGLYPPAALEQFAAVHPGFGWEDVHGTNHYTLVMGRLGAERVSAVIRERLDQHSLHAG